MILATMTVSTLDSIPAGGNWRVSFSANAAGGVSDRGDQFFLRMDATDPQNPAYTFGTVVRNANAFLAEAVHIVGNRRWNRRGAMVTDRYQHVFHHEDVAALVSWASTEALPLIGIDLLPESIPIETFELPERCVLVFGQEGPGLSDEMRSACEVVLSIAQFGSTRSINAGVASGIAMHSWIRTHA